MTEEVGDSDNVPGGMKGGKAIRAILNAAGGAMPLVGGALSAAAGFWSESEQDKVNAFLEQWLRMVQDELKEKAQTVLEIMARLDMNDEKIAERVASPEYQSLLRKAFRDWAGAESEQKRVFIRNILTFDKSLTSDDVVPFFSQRMQKFRSRISTCDSVGSWVQSAISEKYTSPRSV
jgi:hypothetical protein